MAGKIFINYRRDDTRSDAARIRDRLAGTFGEANVFMDVDNLLAGQRFDKELEKALAQCDVFLAVIGPRWLEALEARQAQGERDYVREEIAAALGRGTLVIPVMIERTKLPSPQSLPEDIRALVLHQKHDVTHESFGRDLTALSASIKAARAGQRRGKGGSWGRIAGGIVAVVAVALGLFLGVQQMAEWKQQAEEQSARAAAAEHARIAAEDAAAKAQEERRTAEATAAKRKAAAEQEAAAERERQAAAEAAAAKKKVEQDAAQKAEAARKAEQKRKAAESEQQRQAALANPESPPPANPGSARFCLAPVIGPPDSTGSAMQNAITAHMRQQGLRISGCDGPAYALRTYAVAAKESGEIRVSFIVDVTDSDGRRVHRITGEEAAPLSADPWSNVDDDVAGRIAAKTVSGLAAWLNQ